MTTIHRPRVTAAASGPPETRSSARPLADDSHCDSDSPSRVANARHRRSRARTGSRRVDASTSRAPSSPSPSPSSPSSSSSSALCGDYAISSWRSRECMTMARATTDDRSSLVNHPPSARLEKKRKSPGVLTVCCNHRESNPGLFYIETRRLRQYAFRVRVLWAPRTERRIATLDIGLVHVPPAYCSCENRERV